MNPQGRSADFAKAQANKTNSQIKDFTITRAKYYSLASIDNETMEASKGNANAFMEAATTEIDGSLHSCARSIAIALYRSGSGSIGKVASLSGTVITLSNIEDVVNFEVGMKLNLSTTDGGGSVDPETPKVTAVDRDLGKVTVDSAAGVTVNDYLFVEGDYDKAVKGLAAWIPESSPSPSDNFFGCNRSLDATRLAGIRFDASNMPIEEALISAASRLAREGAKPTHVFMSYSKYADLEKSLGSKVQYVDIKVNTEIGFRGILLNGPRGVMKIVADQNCPSDKAYMLQLDMWKLYSLGKVPKILDQDGMKMLRENSADAVEIRVGAYCQLATRAPGYNAVLKF